MLFLQKIQNTDCHPSKIIQVGDTVICFRDKSNVLKKFLKDYHIKYLVYGDMNTAVTKLYHVPADPYFYFIDKEGKIEKVIAGYYAGVFEEESASIFDSLLEK